MTFIVTSSLWQMKLKEHMEKALDGFIEKVISLFL